MSQYGVGSSGSSSTMSTCSLTHGRETRNAAGSSWRPRAFCRAEPGTTIERETTESGKFASSTRSQRCPSGSCSTLTVVRDSHRRNHADSAPKRTSGTANHHTLRFSPSCPANRSVRPATATHQYQGTHCRSEYNTFVTCVAVRALEDTAPSAPADSVRFGFEAVSLTLSTIGGGAPSAHLRCVCDRVGLSESHVGWAE